MAVFHMDEHESGLCHMHLSILPITEQGKLSSKTLITRDFITSIHKLMSIILRNHGFNMDEYEETEEKKQGGLSAKEYKKKMEQEKEELNKKLEDMVKEYNEFLCPKPRNTSIKFI